MTVKYVNTDFILKVPSDVGELEIVGVARMNRPPGLKKPYEYILSTKRAMELYEQLRALDLTGAQCVGPSKKMIAKGMRLNFYALAYAPGLCGPDDDCAGVSRARWTKFCEQLQSILVHYLGPDALIYVERFSKTVEFEARYEAYIAFKELL